MYVEYRQKKKKSLKKLKEKVKVRDMSHVKFNIAIVQINSQVNLLFMSK